MKLAPNFTFNEMTTTGQSDLLASNRAEARASTDVMLRLHLVAAVLQQVRDHFGKPVVITSGYRGPTLNARIGGSRTSQHMKGEAADFHVKGVDLTEVFRWIEGSGLRFGQLILEGQQQDKPTWIHLSLGYPFRPLAKCGQVLTWDASRGYRNARS